ncbi:MAG: V-type ATP synthase subunit F [Ilumatobacter sp.]
MSTVVALGRDHRLVGFVLAGVRVVDAATEAEIERAWDDLDDDVGLVILSADAAAALRPNLADRPDVLIVELP